MALPKNGVKYAELKQLGAEGEVPLNGQQKKGRPFIEKLKHQSAYRRGIAPGGAQPLQLAPG
jgi:hypothetical protein